MELVISIKNSKSNLNNGNSNKLIVTTVVFSLLIILLYKIYENTFLFAFGITLLFGVFLFMDLKQTLFFMLFLIPSVGMIKLSESGSAWLSYLFLFAEVKHLLLYSNKIKIYLPLLFLLVSISITSLINSDLHILFSCVRFIFISLFLLLLSKEEKIFLYKNTAIDYFVYGTLVNVLIGLLYYVFKGYNPLNGMFAGVSIDRNFFSAVVATAIAFAFVRYLSTDRPVPYAIAIGIMLLGGLLSGSRTFLLAMFFSFLFIILSLFTKNGARRLLPLIIIGLVVAIASSSRLSAIINNVVSRFFLDDVSSGNGRLDSWSFYLKQFAASPKTIMFGCSTNHKLFYSNEYFYGLYPIVEHNTLIQMINETGIFGTLFSIGIYFSFFKVNKCRFRLNRANLLPLVTVIFVFLFINQMMSDTLTLLIFLSSFLFVEQKTNKGCILYESRSN